MKRLFSTSIIVRIINKAKFLLFRSYTERDGNFVKRKNNGLVLPKTLRVIFLCLILLKLKLSLISNQRNALSFLKRLIFYSIFKLTKLIMRFEEL